MNALDGSANELGVQSGSVVALRTAQKNLIFPLDKEKYGIPLSSVKEVSGLANITQIPQVPTFLRALTTRRLL